MATIEVVITIARPIGEVFSAVVDYANVGKWQAGTGKVTVVPDTRLRTGAMVTQERRAGGMDMLLNADVLELQTNKLLEMQGVIGKHPFRDRFEFMPQGRTTQLLHTRRTAGGILTRIFSPFVGMRMKRVMAADLERLKAMLEEK